MRGGPSLAATARHLTSDREEMIAMPKFINIAGVTFGRLIAIDRAGHNADRRVLWRCQCSCGREVVVSGKLLRDGRTKSCGCLKPVICALVQTKHGDAYTRLHRIWRGMKTRCTNHRCKAFPRYGGRGIRVCDDWRRYELFRDWAHANGYSEHLTIDRINNDGHYEPKNCRWASYAEQRQNQRPRDRVK